MWSGAMSIFATVHLLAMLVSLVFVMLASATHYGVSSLAQRTLPDRVSHILHRQSTFGDKKRDSDEGSQINAPLVEP